MKKLRLTTDDSGHWYLVPLELEGVFDEWVEWMGSDYSKPNPAGILLDFESMRIDGPHTLIIHNYSED